MELEIQNLHHVQIHKCTTMINMVTSIGVFANYTLLFNLNQLQCMWCCTDFVPPPPLFSFHFKSHPHKIV